MNLLKRTFVLNPFQRIAGWRALLVGVAVMALTAVFGKLNHIAFDGVLDVHPWTVPNSSMAFAIQAVNFLVLFLTMWLSGVCFSKSKLRAVDIAGTMALSRLPMLLLAIICFLPIMPQSQYDIPRLVVFLLVIIPITVWMIILMYNAYTVSCNLKGIRAVVSFIGTLIVAEVLSKVVLFALSGILFANAPITDRLKLTWSGNTEVVADASLTVYQKTENVVKAFERGDFKAVTIYFDTAMTNAMSTSGLKMAWLETNMQFGKFEKADMENLQEFSVEKYDIVEVPFYFQNEKLKLRLVFNQDDGMIGGVFFLVF